MSTLGLFITGTDTGVGKTYVIALIAAELIARGVRVGAYKPACSGATTDRAGRSLWPDVEALRSAIGGDVPAERVCPQCFTAPLAPPVASQVEGRTVDASLLRRGAQWWDGRVDLLLVEGVGGILCPLTPHETVADLARDLGFPLIVVARNALGTVNHALLTVEVARHRGLRLAAIILNDCPDTDMDESSPTNAAQIAAYVHVPVLRIERDGRTVHLRDTATPNTIDWLALARSASLEVFRSAAPAVESSMAVEIVCGNCANRIPFDTTHPAVDCPHCGAKLPIVEFSSESANSAPPNESDATRDQPADAQVPAESESDRVTESGLSGIAAAISQPETTLNEEPSPVAGAAGDFAADAASTQAVESATPQGDASEAEPPAGSAPGPETEALFTTPTDSFLPQDIAETWSEFRLHEPSEAKPAPIPAETQAPDALDVPGYAPTLPLSTSPIRAETLTPEAARVAPSPASAPVPSPSVGKMSRFWFLLLLSYASAATIACVYLLMRPSQSQPKPHELESLPDVVPPMKKGKIGLRLIEEKASMPLGHTLKLGESQRFGSVRVTPLRVTREMLEFVHFYGEQRRTKPPVGPVLRLWLRFENVSADQTFAPLDQHLLLAVIPTQDQPSRFRANTFLCRAADKPKKDQKVLAYQHPAESEFDLKDQNLGYELPPGETLETYVPTTPEGLDGLSGELIWRVHFRKGYNPETFRGVTTVVEVEFRHGDIRNVSSG